MLYAIVDTNTWLQTALHLTIKNPNATHRLHHHSPGQEEEEEWVINPAAFLQGLATTEVKIVLPAQVVRELDGLKEGRQPQQQVCYLGQ